ncbi:hypothetical protein NQ315_000306 [Exocentrus adspersus]|uniref:Fatty acyl-CoA reductase n=1 Tax=Exocentrus adspersus TaxID=1586481 RepID=A0AAV8VSH5_9CUCU|nr:hypothetical protein NQ315_000306 [Exocentrus adspersus]
MDSQSPVQAFYSGASVFVTGATGFLGRILVEKLLRSCPDIACVYLLIRNKKGKDLQARTEDIFEDVVFDRLKKERPKFRHKVVAVAGDCALPNLGLSEQDTKILLQEVSMIFHVAATVRFDEKLKTATAVNVRAPRDLLRLARQMPKLKVMMHVSTAYSNCDNDVIEERIYPSSIGYKELIMMAERLPDKIFEDITPRILDRHPNTYAFTKQVAENVVGEEGRGLPVGIIRPSIVVSTYKEPIVAWINNMYGATGVSAGAGLGFLRALYCDPDCNANIVPVDMCVNSLIAAAWEVAEEYEKDKTRYHTRIYNYESSNDKPLNWKEFMDASRNHGMLTPSSKAVWYYSFGLYKSYAMYLMAIFILHVIPALLVDAALMCAGKSPKMMKIYAKIHKFSTVISYFCTRQWVFKSENVRRLLAKMSNDDKATFFCDLRELDWDLFFQHYLRGVRVYLVHDPMDTLPEAMRKWNRLYWAHQAIKVVAGFLLLRILWSLLLFIYNKTWREDHKLHKPSHFIYCVLHQLLLKSLIPCTLRSSESLIVHRLSHVDDRIDLDEANLTPIQDFYKDAKVFVTGCTGFLGRILVDKLLRSCPVSTLYLLVREKKGKNVDARLDELFDDVVFRRMKKARPDYRKRVVAVSGDCSLPDLGLGAQDKKMLVDEVTLVFHIAATVRFDETLKRATAINVQATKDMVMLAKQMTRLKAFLHVSTAFANCIDDVIEEKVYPMAMHYKHLTQITQVVDDRLLETLTPYFVEKYPNTYVYTKQIAEGVINEEAQGLPVGIYRPAIVISTYKEPIPGWINNIYGATGVVFGSGMGMLRVLYCDGDADANMVPVDMCINGLIASAWDVAQRFQETKSDFQIPVYNYETTNDKRIDWNVFRELSGKYGLYAPSELCVWTYCIYLIKSYPLYVFLSFFMHMIPGVLMDAYLVINGRKPRLVKTYKKIHSFSSVIAYFCTRCFDFRSANVQLMVGKMSDRDAEVFFCDLKRLDWEDFYVTYVPGARVYLAKDPIDTIEAGKRHYRRRVSRNGKLYERKH